MTKVVSFPRLIPHREDTPDPLQRAEKAIKIAHDLVHWNKSRIAQEIDTALDSLDRQLKLVGDMIDCIPDAATRERLASQHTVLIAAGREIRRKNDTLESRGLLDQVKIKAEPSD